MGVCDSKPITWTVVRSVGEDFRAEYYTYMYGDFSMGDLVNTAWAFAMGGQ